MKKIVILSLTLLCMLTSCNESYLHGVTPGADEDPIVEMSFRASLQDDLSVAVSDDEVVELDLVVCKEGRYQYTRKAYVSEYSKFRSTLKIDTDVDVYFFANARAILKADVLVVDTPWDELQQKLVINYTDTVINNKRVLPMWGQMKGVTISDQTVNNLGTIRLLRSVASANVFFGDEALKNFTPVVMYAYYGADKGYVAPSTNNLRIDNGQLVGVTGPEAPAGMKTERRSRVDAEDGAFVNAVYMLENPTNGSESTNKLTRLVVGGKLKDATDLTFYPLDFFESGSNDLLRVTRNTQYNLTITAVNGEGFPEPNEAAENAPVNIKYEVVEWESEDHHDIGVDGPNYLSISKKHVTLYRNEGATATVRLNGTYSPEEMTMQFVTNHNGEVITIEKGIKNSRFEVTLKKEDGINLNSTLTFKTLATYSDTDSQSNYDTLRIKAGRVQFDILIEQITSRHSSGWDDGGDNGVSVGQ